MTTLHLVRLLLLLGAAQVAAAQSTVNEDANECHSAEYHRNYLLLEMQKTIDEIRQQLDQQQLQHETDIRQLRQTIEIMSTDINECSTNNGGCDTNATCSNTPGSFICKCQTGLTGDGFNCQDINECSINNGGCNKNATCFNTPGSFTCNCKTNFTGNGFGDSGCKSVTPTLTHALSGPSQIFATALLNDQLFVSRLSSPVLVYDKTSLTLRGQIRLPGDPSSVEGLAACATNNYLYASNWGRIIYRVDLSVTNYNVQVTQWNVCHAPTGLSVNKARNLLVACWDPNKVQEYTPDGRLVSEISISGSFLHHAVELSSGLLAVTRWSPIHDIATVSMDGRVIRSYGSGSSGCGVGQMFSPSHMAVDKEGYIIVADSCRGLLVLNPTMTVALPLPLPISLQLPRALSFDEARGRLYVGEASGNRILVFDIIVNFSTLFNN